MRGGETVFGIITKVIGGFNVLGNRLQFFAELEKARESQTKKERRAGVIDNLLNEANQQSDKANVEGTNGERDRACKVGRL